MGDQAELLFQGGHVWTGAAATDAVAVVGGVIVAVGDEARARRGPGTEVVDLAGRTLIPGFRDGHVHVLEGGAESLTCDLTDAADVAEVQERVRAYAAADGGTGWIVGYSYPPEILPGGVGRADVLDAVVPDRPVALWSGDHHMVWLNSRALEVANITAATPDPARGTVVRDDDGAPVGTLLESAEHLLEGHLPGRSRDDEVRGFELGLARMAAAGLVFAQEAATPPGRVAAYQRVADRGGLSADIDLAFRVDPERWREQVEEFREARHEVDRGAARRHADHVRGGRLTARTVKLFMDGVIEGGTGALLEPYEDAKHDHGLAFWEREELVAAATAMDLAGFELHLHAIGDAAVRSSLDAFAAVAAANGPRDRRSVTAHTHLIHPDDLPRFRELGVTANFEPLWAQANGVMVDLTEPRLGQVRSTWQYPIGSLIRGGAPVSFGSDWPVSSPVPTEGIAVAVTRQTSEGHPPAGWLPQERITLDQALQAYTAGTAWQCRDEGRTGSIEVGRDADLALLGADLRAVPMGELAEVPVLGTWLAGRRVDGEGRPS